MKQRMWWMWRSWGNLGCFDVDVNTRKRNQTKIVIAGYQVSSQATRSRSVARKITSNLIRMTDRLPREIMSVTHFQKTPFVFIAVLCKSLSLWSNNVSFLNLHHQSIIALWTCDSLQFRVTLIWGCRATCGTHYIISTIPRHNDIVMQKKD